MFPIPLIPLPYLFLAAALVSGAGAGILVYKLEQGEITNMKAAQAIAITEAVVQAQKDQRDSDAVTLDLTVAEGKGQIQIVEKFRTIREEIPIYVQDDSRCITYGLIRLLDAAALGADPESLLLPASEYNDSCAPVKATDLAESVTGNYEAAWANAQQLGTAQAWARDVERKSSGRISTLLRQ